MGTSVDERYAVGNRWSWLAGGAGVALALLRLGRLLRPTVEGAPWQVAVVAGAIMGTTITWAMRSRWSMLLANLAALFVVTLRIVIPSTLVAGILPTAQSLHAFRSELDLGILIIRSGVAPVTPVAGLVIILTAVFWVLAALIAWGIRTHHPVVALLPPLLFYLQLAVIDQDGGETPWTVAFLIVMALVLWAIAHDSQLDSTLHMRSSHTIRSPFVYPALFVISSVALAFGGVHVVENAIPASGLVDWRSHTGLGGGVLVGVSYNLFTSIHQDLLSPTDTPVFTARVEGDVDPSTLYWELITLEEFDGRNWIPRERDVKSPGADTWEDPEMAFFGPTTPVSASVRIASLTQNFLPVLYSPTWLGSDLAIFNDSYGVRTDGAVQFNLFSFENLTYQEAALVPTPDIDVLASTGGTLTPIFQEAADKGVFDGHAVPTPAVNHPASLSADLELPRLDPIIQTKARELTADGTSTFEKALLLEAWFRDPNNFTYSTDIDPGHSATNLADWLFTTDSPSYRTGYCEQFATAMAVMARTINIPSRVVTGFGPGQVQPDGTIVVRDRNAHAWVELWMNNQGWVRFDPTPGGGGTGGSTVGLVGFDARQYIPPPPEETDTTSPSDSASSGREFTPDFGERPDVPLGSGGDVPTADGPFLTPTRIVLLALLLIVSSPLLIKTARRRRRLARLKRGEVSAAWEELVDHLDDLKREPSPAATPLEVAESVHRSMVPLAVGVTQERFGRSDHLDGTVVAAATRSFIETESYLKTIHPIGNRLRARMRLRSLIRR
jgi:transglutaminase-like putative cysteine protease